MSLMLSQSLPVQPLVNQTADAFQQLIKKHTYFLNSFGCN